VRPDRAGRPNRWGVNRLARRFQQEHFARIDQVRIFANSLTVERVDPRCLVVDLLWGGVWAEPLLANGPQRVAGPDYHRGGVSAFGLGLGNRRGQGEHHGRQHHRQGRSQERSATSFEPEAQVVSSLLKDPVWVLLPSPPRVDQGRRQGSKGFVARQNGAPLVRRN
jgi:hypothetical protein